jgi:hypothetical protein
MKKLITVIALIVLSITSYSQDARIEMLVHRDNGGNVAVILEDYGNTSYITMGGSIIVKVTSYSQKGMLFTYKFSYDGQSMGTMYFDLDSDRFTVALLDGVTWNGDILHKEQTI